MKVHISYNNKTENDGKGGSIMYGFALCCKWKTECTLIPAQSNCRRCKQIALKQWKELLKGVWGASLIIKETEK